MAALEWVQAKGACEATACVEVATEYGYVLIRSTLVPREIIRFTAEEWLHFSLGMRCGDFDQVDPIRPPG